MAVKKVLVTGATGLVGSSLCLRLLKEPDRYDVHVLDRSREMSDRVPEGRKLAIPEKKFHLCDLQDMEGMRKAVQGMDTVVHLAADPSGHNWDSVLANNIIGAYHVFEACREAGVGRLVFASTIQVSSGNSEQEPYHSLVEGRSAETPAGFAALTVGVPAEPRNIYASSKVWGESLARTYAHRFDMSCLCVRIGWVVAEDQPRNKRGDIWCSQRDIAQIFQRCIDAPTDLRFDIFYGMSDNKRRWVDIENARRKLGYAPLDRAED